MFSYKYSTEWFQCYTYNWTSVNIHCFHWLSGREQEIPSRIDSGRNSFVEHEYLQLGSDIPQNFKVGDRVEHRRKFVRSIKFMDLYMRNVTYIPHVLSIRCRTQIKLLSRKGCKNAGTLDTYPFRHYISIRVFAIDDFGKKTHYTTIWTWSQL